MRRGRAALAVLASAGVLAGLSAVPVARAPAASGITSARAFAAALKALAHSADGRAAEAGLRRANSDPASARSIGLALKQYRGSLSPFQAGMLRAAESVSTPAIRGGLSRIAAGQRPTVRQARALRRQLKALGRNPALQALIRAGRQLKRSPARLTAILSALAAAPEGTAPAAAPGADAVLGPALAVASHDLATPPVSAAMARVRALLAAPAAARFVARLPPLFVAALLPSDQLASLSVAAASGRGRAHTADAAPILSPKAHTGIDMLLDQAKDTVVGEIRDVALQEVVPALGVLAAAAGAVEFGASVVILASAAVVMAAVVDVIGYTRTLYQLYILNHPASIKLSPSTATIGPPPQSQHYDIVAFYPGGRPAGATNGALTIDGQPCYAYDCAATTSGRHVVRAESGKAKAEATLIVTPGALTKITLTPEETTAEAGQPVTYTVTGADDYGNVIDGVAVDFADGAETLTVTPDGSCKGAVCTVARDGDHTVTASDRGIKGTATIHIVATKLVLPAPALSRAIQGKPYSATLQALGGTAPYTWSSGPLPAGLSLDPATGVIAGTPTATGTFSFPVTVIDKPGATQTATASLTVEPPPVAQVLVTDSGSDTVAVMSTVTDNLIATVTVGNAPTSVAVTPDGTSAWVTNRGSNSVSVIDTSTDTVVDTIPVGQEPQDIAISSDGRVALVTDYGDSTLTILSTTTHAQVGQSIPTGGGGSPYGVAISPDGTTAYVTGYANDFTLHHYDLSIIDLGTGTILGTPFTGQNPEGVALTPDGRFAFVANSQSTAVSLIDTSTRTNTEVANDDVGSDPVAVAISGDGARTYVANSGSATVSVLGNGSLASSNTIDDLATIPVGSGPDGIGLAHDGARAYVANGGSNTLSVIDTATETVIDTIPIGSFPTGVAVVPGS